MHMAATWFNIGDVARMGFTTQSRALKWRLLAILRCLLMLLCGSLEISTPHKEKTVLPITNYLKKITN
jgi:hypothetical protein